MSDLKKYINDRKEKDPEFANGYELGYKNFIIGTELKQARLEKGITQEQLANLLHTKKTAISRIENHAADIKLSTLEKIANALGKEIRVQLL